DLRMWPPFDTAAVLIDRRPPRLDCQTHTWLKLPIRAGGYESATPVSRTGPSRERFREALQTDIAARRARVVGDAALNHPDLGQPTKPNVFRLRSHRLDTLSCVKPDQLHPRLRRAPHDYGNQHHSCAHPKARALHQEGEGDLYLR